jgi:hypothetical protein
MTLIGWDLVTMSGRELQRIEVLSEVLARHFGRGDSGVEHEADVSAAQGERIQWTVSCAEMPMREVQAAIRCNGRPDCVIIGPPWVSGASSLWARSAKH